MTSSVMHARPSRHRVISEIDPQPVKATLRKAETVNYQAEIGACLFRARSILGWTLEQLAAALPPPAGADKRDARQVRRWESGEERTPVDVVFAVPELRQPFAYQLSKLSGARTSLGVEFSEAV